MAKTGIPKGQTNNPSGRPKGIPNKATTDSRAAIAMFVDNNTHRLQEWLDDIAKGVKNEANEYIVKPDPVAAFKMVSDILEYHVPKLSRAEVQPLGKDGKPADNKITIEFVGKD
jgi:hypothetical protein